MNNEEKNPYIGQMGYGHMLTNKDRVNVLSSIIKGKQYTKLYKIKFSISMIRTIFLRFIKQAIDHLRMIYQSCQSCKNNNIRIIVYLYKNSK